MTADTVGGVWTYCVELAHALDAEVHLATMGRRMSDDQRSEAQVFATVHESDFPLEWQDDPWQGVDAAGVWLLGLERELQPDVVHLNGYAHATLPWAAPTVVVAHSDVVSWWRAVHEADAPPEWDEYRRRVTAGLRAAGCVVAPTRAVAHDLRASYGVEGVTVVPNCRRAALVRPGDKQRTVLAAGRLWDAAKGIDALCRVAPSLDVRVAVAGEGAAPGVEALGLLPFPELAALMAQAAVFAAPARYEPFGLGILEAGLAGCALVLGDLASLREVWGDAATYVQDDASLAAALVAALDDPARGAAARERALTYTPERTAAGYLEAYAA
ncbi:MAG: a-glycosyltransferase, Glycosyltransferase Family 4-like protein [Frankiales bacterium]|nr:a-glycosyltransferase, Glycosyltransferase Family 4-like protein [Frankiales bacterium]